MYSLGIVEPQYWYEVPQIFFGNCGVDYWLDTNVGDAPLARRYHTAVWTGTAMIVWGGNTSPPDNPTNTGGRFYPSTFYWTATSTVDVPSARER